MRLIEEAKRNYFVKAGKTLASPVTSSKTYWTLISTVLKKVKIPMIPPLLENGLFVMDLTEKAQIFDDYLYFNVRPLTQAVKSHKILE